MGSGASKKAEGAAAKEAKEAKEPKAGPSGEPKEPKASHGRPPLPKRSKDEVAASSAAKHQPLLDAKVENEDVEEAMAEAIASPKKGHSHSSHSSHSIPSQPIEVSQVSQAPKVEPEGLAEEEIAQIAIACRMGEIEVVKAFVEKAAAEAKSHESAHLEGRLPCEALLDEYGESLLHHAAHGGHGEIVRILLELGQVQPDIPNARNETALSVACRKADEAVALELLKAAANPNRCASDGLTPFLAAVLGSASDNLLDALLQMKADVNAQDHRGVGALHSLALSGNMRLMKWLMTHSADLDLQTEHGTTALMLASKRGSEEGVAMLLAARANPNLSNKAGSTALVQAFASNMNVAFLLMENGASVDIVDSAGRSALFHAVISGEEAAIEAVIRRGGRVNILDEDSRTPLYQACLMGSLPMAKMLLAADADPNLAGRGSSLRPQAEEEMEDGAAKVLLEEARTCVQVSAMLAQNELLLCLLDHHADINSAPGTLGWSALHLCALVNNEEGAEKLLAHGAAICEDVEGNTAKMLAERAGHHGLVELLRDRSAPADLKGQLPPLGRPGAEEAPEDAPEEPLEYFKDEWEANVSRPANDSLLDSVFGPMVHDAMMSQQWRDRWQAHIYISRRFAGLGASAGDLVQAVSQATCMATRDKMPKVFLASLSLLDELLSDSRVDEIGPEDFLALLQTEEGNMISLLLDQTDVGGGSSNSTSPQQAAAGALCSCVLHGRISLDDVALPLMLRMDQRLCALAMATAKREKELSSKTPVAAKCLASNLKLVGRIIASFGLQQSGLFRRALVLPLLLRASACEHSKVRAAAGDCLLQLLGLSGGIEERVFSLLPGKAQKRLQSLAAGQEGVPLLSAVACDEDAMSKEDIVAEDGRAADLWCVSELNGTVWASLQAGRGVEAAESPKASAAVGSMASLQSLQSLDDAAALDGLASKNWKRRAECISKLFTDLATASEGVKLLKDSDEDGGPLLSQYVLGDLRISMLQSQLSTLLVDSVTAVFVNAADLLCLICSQVPLYIAPLFLEPLLPALFGRLLDTSQKVRQKTAETTLEVCSLHSSALSEMVAQCVSSSSAWTSSDRSGTDRSTGPRLQLLGQMVKRMHDRDSAKVWSDETWSTLADYALKASENKSAEVRKEASNLLENMAAVGGRASEIADQAATQIKAMAEERAKQKMRPGTGVRPLTGRLGTGGSRPSTGALGGTGRLSTGGFNRSGSFRPGTGRPGTSLSRSGTMTLEEESDNSLHSDAEIEAGEDGVKFFDVKNACGGADEVPELAEGEAALKEALPLAEALDEVALDFVAPLIALFGEGWTRCFYSRNWQCRVAALTHLSAMAQRLEDVSDAPLAELLDGCMRAVHEGLGDQNVRVYAEACMAVTAIVPSFCGTVDGRLLVAHLAPLLRQLCARMGDSKEVVRTQTTQAMFRLLSPPTGNIVSPVAIAMLILRHLMPSKEEGDSPLASVSKGATGKGAVTGWLCRLSALRQLCKEYPKMIVQQPGSSNPGEWLRLSDGLKHADPSVRHQAVRLYTLVCKMHLRSLGDEESQRPARETWVASLPKDVPVKSIGQVRRYLKLPEVVPEESPEVKRSLGMTGMTIACIPWDVPSSLADWAGCSSEILGVLSAPRRGDEKHVIAALKALGKGNCGSSGSLDEAFSNICRAIQQALAAPTGADRYVFLCAVELCQSSVQQLGTSLSGLDLNMALGKVFPTLLERTALSSLAGDVKVGVASDKLVQQLAKHPKVGCEAVTKMVIASISRSEHPVRQLVLLRTLLSDFGLRLCAQKDVVALLLSALGGQLERVHEASKEASEAIRPQLIGVLATCKQFSNETVRFCLSEVDTSQRKLLCAALAEAPDPQLMALGATAAEQESAGRAFAVGSAIRAASRSRGMSPLSEPGEKPRPAVLSRHTSRSNLGKPPEAPSLRRSDSQKTDKSDKTEKSEKTEEPLTREASPRSTSTRRRRRIDCSPQQPPRGPRSLTLNQGGVLSEASTAASTDFPSESPRKFGSSRTTASTPNLNKSLEGSPRPWPSAKPPAPMSLSTALKGDSASWRFRDESKGEDAAK